MNLALVACIFGTLMAVQLPVMPDLDLLGKALPLAVLGACYSNSRSLAALFLGLYLGLFSLDGRLAARLPVELVGEKLLVWGTVVSMPELRDQLQRFRFRVDRCEQCGRPLTVLLSQYDLQPVLPGERWRLLVRLNRPRGSVNPGLFDYQAWLLAQGIDATGYVLEGERLSASPAVPHQQLRSWLRQRLQMAMPMSRHAGLLLALSLGDSAQISPAQWRVLSATGTNHLLIISGLHVGLIAGLSLALLNGLLRPLRNARVWAYSLTLLVVGVYAGLAGLGLPVQRALIMLVCASALVTLRRHVTGLALWLYALLIVSLVNPLASLMMGFWLSFGAVFLLIYGFAGRRRQTPVVDAFPASTFGVLETLRATQIVSRWLASLLRSQWLVFFGMTPLLFYFVGQLAGLAFVANLVAIPLVGLIIVPLLLLALIAAPMSLLLTGILLRMAEQALHYLWVYLEALASLGWVHYAVEPHFTSLLLGVLGGLVVLQPAGFLPRWPGLLMILPLALGATPSLPATGEAEITVLDVGQGLSVVVRVNGGNLLYDAGPSFSDRFDAGEQIVSPYLRRLGVEALDVFLVSHGDADHAGGAAAVSNNFPVTQQYLGEFSSEGLQTSKFVKQQSSCREARQWRLGEVDFHLLGVGDFFARSANNQSCLLLVQAAGFSVLIPGDIEAETELALLSATAHQLLPRVDVLIAPHHGSLTSSHPAFLNQLRPSAVVFSAGFRNRFEHPHSVIVARYEARSIQMFNTATDGAVVIKLGKTLEIHTSRSSYPRIWYD